MGFRHRHGRARPHTHGGEWDMRGISLDVQVADRLAEWVHVLRARCSMISPYDPAPDVLGQAIEIAMDDLQRAKRIGNEASPSSRAHVLDAVHVLANELGLIVIERAA